MAVKKAQEAETGTLYNRALIISKVAAGLAGQPEHLEQAGNLIDRLVEEITSAYHDKRDRDDMQMRAVLLREIASNIAKHGNLRARSAAIFDTAAASARAIKGNKYLSSNILCEIVTSMMDHRQMWERAQEIAGSIRDSGEKDLAYNRIAVKMAKNRESALEAIKLLSSIKKDHEKAIALSEVAAEVAKHDGLIDKARELYEQAEAIARAMPDSPRPMLILIEKMASQRDFLEQAKSLIPNLRMVDGSKVHAFCSVGAFDEALNCVNQFYRASEISYELARIAASMAKVEGLLPRAINIANSINILESSFEKDAASAIVNELVDYMKAEVNRNTQYPAQLVSILSKETFVEQPVRLSDIELPDPKKIEKLCGIVFEILLTLSKEPGCGFAENKGLSDIFLSDILSDTYRGKYTLADAFVANALKIYGSKINNADAKKRFVQLLIQVKKPEIEKVCGEKITITTAEEIERVIKEGQGRQEISREICADMNSVIMRSFKLDSEEMAEAERQRGLERIIIKALAEGHAEELSEAAKLLGVSRWVGLATSLIEKHKAGISPPAEIPEAENGGSSLYDTEFATVLLSDLAYAQLQEGNIYEVKYDTSRLSASQIDIVEEYIRLLKLRSSNPDNIRPKPFSSAQGSNESLIAVYCTGKDFKGEGHVDITIQEGELKDYILRITGMMNIALASSNIPDNLSKEDMDKYLPILSYINNQYKAIAGEELAIPDSPGDILKVIRKIILGLPKSLRSNINEIEKYNALAKQALAAA